MRSVRELPAGNASSQHAPGITAAKEVERARCRIAEEINAEPDEVVFTSGGTESNNLAVFGVALASRGRGAHVIISEAEHPSVREPALRLRGLGFEVTSLSLDREGRVDPAELKSALRRDTVLVSVIHASNEIGTIEPVAELGAVCEARGVPFHTDACQSFTRTELDVRSQSLGLVSMNAHKIHGPAGVGALYVRKGLELEALTHGGGQERGLRPGTLNTAGIAGFGRAVEIARREDAVAMARLRDNLIRRLEETIDGVSLNGPRGDRLCNNVNVAFSGAGGKAIFNRLNAAGVHVSTGSACDSNSSAPSRVLLACGRSPEAAHGSVRLSLSKWTTGEELDRAAEALAQAVREEREGR